VSKVAEGVLEESTTGTESAVVASPPSPAGEGTSSTLPQPAEAVATALAASVVDVAEGVVGGARPQLPRSVAAAAEEVLVSGQLTATSQERDAPEGTTREASSDIQKAKKGMGAALS
jgi:hypothetical protein